MITQRQPGDNIVIFRHFDTRLTGLVVVFASIALCFCIWSFTASLLANPSFSSTQKITGVFFVAALSLFLAIASAHSIITALFYPRALILLNGTIGTASVHSSRVFWQSYCDVADIREVVMAYDKRTCELWLVTNTQKKLALLSGSRTFIQDFAQQVLDQISKVVPDLPRYREELISYTGTPRSHQSVYTIVQASHEQGRDSIRIPYGRVRRYQPNARQSWFGTKVQTLDCPGLMVHMNSHGIRLEYLSYSEDLAWEKIANYEIKTVDIQVPESGTNTVYWLVLKSPSENLLSISGMSGPDAEWLLFLAQQRRSAHMDTHSAAPKSD